MNNLNWNIFSSLPGADNANFEKLWRKLVWRHYSQYGSFRARANQPGVEFHLKLNRSCDLGEVGRWYGWQCKWYDIRRGVSIGKNRKGQIEDSLRKTEEFLPKITDWVLCTRHILTKKDQEWFDGLQSQMQLHLWSSEELEEHLEDPGLVARRTYFGELVLSPGALKKIHQRSVVQIGERWKPDVHQELNVERILRRNLLEIASWTELPLLIERLTSGTNELISNPPEAPPDVRNELEALIHASQCARNFLEDITKSLEDGDILILRQALESFDFPRGNWNTLLCRLRGMGHPCVLYATNLLADIYGAVELEHDLKQAVDEQSVAVIANAGCGKTQLAAQLTADKEDRPAGILLYGKNLRAGQTLDNLAGRIKIQYEQVQNFDALLAAVDTAGERSGRRLPIVIDGLDEAEDPRNWKDELASMSITLSKYPHVLLICTLRPTFDEQALPSEGLKKLEMRGFENYTDAAIDRYFQHYRINLGQIGLSRKLLSHPLTLRMFCEVANPKCQIAVTVESVSSSLTALFEKHIEQVAGRIQELAHTNTRHQDSEVRTTINKVGLAFWENNTRQMGEDQTRLLIGDSDRPWPDSMMCALQDNGVLLRETGRGSDFRFISFIFDSFGGYIIASALLKHSCKQDWKSWIQDAVNAKLIGNENPRHPLAEDIFQSLVGLFPRRHYRCHLWKLLKGVSKNWALRETALLESEYLDDQTVSELARLIDTASIGYGRIFDRVWDIRATSSHPLNALFLDSVLRPMSISDRDRKWTEWVRVNAQEIIYDLQQIDERWHDAKSIGDKDLLLAKWIMWTLTSTVRRLRDYATRAMYRFGCLCPRKLFKITLDSLQVNDPYVSERMLAACYGVAMSLWADPDGNQLREELPKMAKEIIAKMFAPDAPYGTRHVLTRDYATGLVTLAIKVNPQCIPEKKLRYITEHGHIPSPFPEANTITDSDIAESKSAVHMDFENYTIGRLIPDRYNYDYSNPMYQDVLDQIYWRILDLGYSPSGSTPIDQDKSRYYPGYYGKPDVGKVDRYGKKYSWIAFFEMYGIHLDKGILPAQLSDCRPSDMDIDPSFPDPPKTWMPELPDLFNDAPVAPKDWCKDGPVPDYGHLMKCSVVDQCQGPWVLLHGSIEQITNADERLVWNSIRCFLIRSNEISDFHSKAESAEYMNSHFPDSDGDYHTYAGEISWSSSFGGDLRDPSGKAIPNIREAFTEYKNGTRQAGIEVEIPIHQFVWEDYTLQSNHIANVYVPSPSLCEHLGLHNHQGEWDLFDRNNSPASLFRVLKNEQGTVSGHLAYLRFDLLGDYLEERELIPLWLFSGDRSFRSRSLMPLLDEIRDIPSGYRKIFRDIPT